MIATNHKIIYTRLLRTAIVVPVVLAAIGSPVKAEPIYLTCTFVNPTATKGERAYGPFTAEITLNEATQQVSAFYPHSRVSQTFTTIFLQTSINFSKTTKYESGTTWTDSWSISRTDGALLRKGVTVYKPIELKEESIQKGACKKKPPVERAF